MPRNGSGVYSLPGTYEAVTGEQITSLQHNAPLEDLESDANDARPIAAGGTGATSKAAAQTALDILPTTGGTVTGALVIGTAGSLAFEGATANDYETTLAVTDPTADRTVTLPDATGTVLLDTTDVVVGTGKSVIFEGATADAYETTLTVTDPTADRTITLPDATGTVILSSGGTITGELLFSTAATIAFEGSSDNAYETRLAFTDPTADRTITFKDGSGTVAFTSDIVAGGVNTQTFNSTGTWTKPSGTTASSRCYVQIWGGGAGGNTDSGGSEGAGGGGGGYADFWVLASALGATETATVGAGGATSTNGGNSTFYSYTVTGGKKPAGQSTADTGGAITGAPSGTAYAAGAVGASSTYGGGGGGSYAQTGGSSVWGGGGGTGRNGISNGTSVFGGAGGSSNVAGTAPGGGGGWNKAGAAGRIIVTTFL